MKSRSFLLACPLAAFGAVAIVIAVVSPEFWLYLGITGGVLLAVSSCLLLLNQSGSGTNGNGCSTKELEDAITTLEEEPIDLDFHIKRNETLRRADSQLRSATKKNAEGDRSGASRCVQEGLRVIRAYYDHKSGATTT